jgi:hypothetical protein
MSRPSMARLRTRLGFLMMSVVMLPVRTNLFGDVSDVDMCFKGSRTLAL